VLSMHKKVMMMKHVRMPVMKRVVLVRTFEKRGYDCLMYIHW
jgi:hypothetical protein